MTTQQTMTAELWSRLVESHRAYTAASHEFLAREDRIDVFRKSLRGKDRRAALALVRSLTDEEKLELFPEWIYLASWGHGAIHIAREMILSLPRDWVLANIASEVEPYLKNGTDEEYRRFLELYEQLDAGLRKQLAHRATAHSDLDIREAGEDFLAADVVAD